MPPKLRQLIARLEKAGFKKRGGKGSHVTYFHKELCMNVTLSGNPGSDAKRYQEKLVQKALEEVQGE